MLQSKDALIDGIHAVLRERDEAYMRLLHRQAEETDGLVALLAGEYDRFRRGTEQALEAVEAAYLQVVLGGGWVARHGPGRALGGGVGAAGTMERACAMVWSMIWGCGFRQPLLSQHEIPAPGPTTARARPAACRSAAS